MTKKTTTPFTGVTRIVLAIAMAGSCALAQTQKEQAAPATTTESASMETELAPVTVLASNGVATPVNETGVSVTVLNVKELRKEGVLTVSDALSRVPGVYILPGGGAYQQGNGSKPVIRGMSKSSYTLISMDGMRLTDGGGNLSSNIVGRHNLFAIGQLEVLKGSQAAVHGGGAVAGVIAMDTPQGQGEPSFTLFNEYGSFSSYLGSLTAQGQVDKLSYFINATYNTTDNDMEYADGTKPKNDKAGYHQAWNEAIRLDYQANEYNKTTATYKRQDARYYNEDVNYNMRSNLFTVKHATIINDCYDSNLMFGYYGDNNKLSDTYFNQTRDIQIEWNNNYKWNEQNKTLLGTSWNQSRYQSGDGKTKTNQSHLEDNVYGFYAEHKYEPVKNWNNSLAARLDYSDTFDALYTFRAASSYLFNEETTRVFASIGSGYLAPSSFQRSNSENTSWGTTYKGNPDLDVESTVSADFGIEQKIADNHNISATYFWLQQTDAIIASPTAKKGVLQYQNNDGHLLSQGVELAMSGVIEETWKTGYSLSFTYTQPKDDDTQIADTARQTWSADIHTSPIEKLTIGLGAVAAADRTGYDSSRLDNYYSLRAYANYEVNEHLSLHLRAENLTDQRFVTSPRWDGAGYIAPGTAIYGGCTIKF